MGSAKHEPPVDEIPVLPKNKDIHKLTRALICSFINTEANFCMQAAKSHASKNPLGDEMV